MKKLYLAAFLLFAISLFAVAARAQGIAINKDTSLQGSGSVASPLGVNFTNVQKRIGSSCTAGTSIRAIDSLGAVTCETDDNTTYSAGTGLSLSVTTFSVDTAVIQARVSGTCSAGNAIRVINSDGTVTCETTTTFSTNNTIPKGDGTGLTASSWTDNGTTSTTTGALAVNGNTTLGDATSDTATLNGSATVNLPASGTFLVNGLTGGASSSLLNVKSNGTAGSGNAALVRLTNTNNVIAEMRMADTGSTTGYDKEASMLALSTQTGYGIKLNTNSSDNSGIRIASGAPGAVTIYGAASINGNATIGDTPTSDTHTINGVTTIKAGTSSGVTAAPAGTIAAFEQANGVSAFVYIMGNTSKFLAFGNGSAALDGGVSYDSASSRGLALLTANGGRLHINSSGQIFVGDTSGTVVSDNLDVFTAANTGTGQTTTGKAVIATTNTGSYSTAGGNVTYYGGNFAVSATESAGANTLTGVALRTSATNSDDAIGLWVDDGRAQFDGAVTIASGLNVQSSGITISGSGLAVQGGDASFDQNVTIGNANTDTLTVTAKVNSKVYYTGTAPNVTGSCGTSATVVGNDTAGTVTIGTGTPTSCTVTFAGSYTTNPGACQITSQIATRGDLVLSASSTSAFTVTSVGGANLASGKFNYFCPGLL